MNRFARLLVAAILALALPLQTVGAATMTLCARDHAPQAAPEATTVATADGSAHEACHSKPAQNADCNQCSLCHLACASALPSSMPMLSDVRQDAYVTTLAFNVTSYLPDPLLKPPRGDLR
jgi:hypothetical protein